jgi:hypothetical protein
MIRNYTIDTLRAEIREHIAAAKLLDDDLTQRVADVVLAGLQHRHGATKIYIPVDYSRAYPLKDILQAYAKGESPRAICRRHGISRSVFYRLLNSS